MSKPMSFVNPADRPVSAMPTTPPAGPDRIASLPRNRFRRRQAARRHHEHQPGSFGRTIGIEIACDLRHIALQDRRKIAVDHGGVAAADQLDQRRYLMAGGDLRKPDLARQRRNAPFMVAGAIGMHQHDSDGADAVRLGALQFAAQRVEIELALDRAVGAHALVDLDTRS